MSESVVDKVEQDRLLLMEAQEKGALGRCKIYFRLSGPGWIASAITLGGGSLASSLFLGVLGGYSLLWVQPLAMILGVIMLGAIGYVTLSSGERPFRAINDHVNPVLGWGWALAVAAANVVWCMPQFSLANGVLTQNLMAGWLGDDGSLVHWAAHVLGYGVADGAGPLQDAQAALADAASWGQYLKAWLAVNANKALISLVILVLAIIVTGSYDRGGWGLRLYETVLKIMVAIIVLCFLGVILRLAFSAQGLDWKGVVSGFVPDFGQIFRPAASYGPLLDAVGEVGTPARDYWSRLIVDQQRDVMISAAATAVGINMTLMFPYPMIRKGWTREFRGLSMFDLWTGLFIPYVLATSFVVIAAGAAFHTQPPEGFSVDLAEDGGIVAFHEPDLSAEALATLSPADQSRIKAIAGRFSGEKGVLTARTTALPDIEPSLAEKRIASMIVTRDTFDLAAALTPLTGPLFANLIFGLGVLAMVLSTISILMLISGFVFAEMTGYPPAGKMHKLGMLVAGVGGALWPFIWVGKSQAFLAVRASVLGFMLLPFAYVTFVFLMNSSSLLGGDVPRGAKRFIWNAFAILAAGAASIAAVYMIWVKGGLGGVIAVILYIALAIMVYMNRVNRRREEAQANAGTV